MASAHVDRAEEAPPGLFPPPDLTRAGMEALTRQKGHLRAGPPPRGRRVRGDYNRVHHSYTLSVAGPTILGLNTL